MKYYLTIVQNDSSQVVNAYNTMDDAMSAYHSELAYRAEGRNSTLCMLADSTGRLYHSELWERDMGA